MRVAVFRLCLSQFRYSGGVSRPHPRSAETKKAFTLPARMESSGGPAAALSNASFAETPAGKGGPLFARVLGSLSDVVSHLGANRSADSHFRRWLHLRPQL